MFRRTFFIYVLFGLLFLQMLIPSSFAATYTLGVTEGDELLWETTEYDEDTIEEMVDKGIISTYYESVSEGHKLKLVITFIDETSDTWEISADGYLGADGTEYDSSITWVMYKDPKELADEVFEDDEVAILLVLFPVDVEDYLDEFSEEIPSSWEHSILIRKNKFIQNITYSQNVEVISEYNDDGVAETYTIEYDGEVAYERELISVKNNRLLYIIIGVCVIGGIAAGIIILVVSKNKKKQRQGPIPQQMAPYPPVPAQDPTRQIKPPPSRVEPEDDLIQRFCPMCGEPRSLGAQFCEKCGEKFE